MVDAVKPKKSDLGVRVLSAIVMVIIAGGAFWASGPLFIAFIFLIGVGAFWEYCRLVLKLSAKPLSRFILILIGMIYIGIPIVALWPIGIYPDGPSDILLPLLAVVVATDVGAYFSGRTIGGPKIAPSISPSKTWSGLLGGMMLAGLVMALLHHWQFLDAGPYGKLNFTSSVFFGAGLAVVAQAGDFLESHLKRKAGVKDSSNLIPGHGGLLDRLDGLLAVLLVCIIAFFISFGGGALL